MVSRTKTFKEVIAGIEIEDLQYIETDLCFHQQVSLGFLLYGRERSHAEFILQKLIILSQNPPEGKGFNQMDQLLSSGILTKYASINAVDWRVHVIEALAIIRAKRVLRKMGVSWTDVHNQYLPHVAEISLNVHPLLKALYKVCERLNLDQAERLVNYINNKYSSHNLRFYDASYLEIFLVHWLTQRIIDVGDQKLQGSNVQCLIEFFKFNDMDSIKDLLLITINHNLRDIEPPPANDTNHNQTNISNFKDSGVSMSNEMPIGVNKNEKLITTLPYPVNEYDAAERYSITTKNAGYIVIINQSKFYEEQDPKLKHLLPKTKFKPTRDGTDVDRDALIKNYSSFGYTPLVFNNITHLEILHNIRETVKKSLVKDSIIICILSHGMEGVVYGCNSIPVSIAEIRDILTNDALKGKPKFLIIQACQKNISEIDTSFSNSITEFNPDAYADILLALSAMPGTEAIRHTISGSWFVESLCRLTQKYGESKHNLDILTAVTREISNKKGKDNEVMLPITQTTLRKEFYLPMRVKNA